jgi:serine/threonine protein phosphatase PrpC
MVLASKGPDGAVGHEVLGEIHKASVESEKARIKAAGGMVMRGRVYGDLAISRALGDSQYKRPTAEGDFVSAIPATKQVPLREEHAFLVLATDGLWDKVSFEETVNIVKEKLDADPQYCCKALARELTELTIERGSGDNVTIIVVVFEWGEPGSAAGPPASPSGHGSDAVAV